MAAEAADAECCALLLDAGADVHLSVDGEWGTQMRPLHLAVVSTTRSAGALVNTVQLLLSHGADVCAATGDGKTPLHMAVRVDRSDCVLILAPAAAAVHAVDQMTQNDETALLIGAMRGHARCVKALLDYGASAQRSEALQTAREQMLRCSPGSGGRDAYAACCQMLGG